MPDSELQSHFEQVVVSRNRDAEQHIYNCYIQLANGEGFTNAERLRKGVELLQATSLMLHGLAFSFSHAMGVTYQTKWNAYKHSATGRSDIYLYTEWRAGRLSGTQLPQACLSRQDAAFAHSQIESINIREQKFVHDDFTKTAKMVQGLSDAISNIPSITQLDGGKAKSAYAAALPKILNIMKQAKSIVNGAAKLYGSPSCSDKQAADLIKKTVELQKEATKYLKELQTFYKAQPADVRHEVDLGVERYRRATNKGEAQPPRETLLAQTGYGYPPSSSQHTTHPSQPHGGRK